MPWNSNQDRYRTVKYLSKDMYSDVIIVQCSHRSDGILPMISFTGKNNAVQQYRANTAIHIVQRCTVKCFLHSPELYSRVPGVDELGSGDQAGEIEESKVLTVPDGIWGKCLEPGIQGTSQGNSGVWWLSQALSALSTPSEQQERPSSNGGNMC